MGKWEGKGTVGVDRKWRKDELSFSLLCLKSLAGKTLISLKGRLNVTRKRSRIRSESSYSLHSKCLASGTTVVQHLRLYRWQ